jgi:hypothetical protein
MVRRLLTLQWLLIGAAVLLAATAWARARRASRRLDRLTDSYWELRYEYGQLRARLTALDPPQAGNPPANDEPNPEAGPGRGTAFVPLSSLKR